MDVLDQLTDRTYPDRPGRPEGQCRLCTRESAGSSQLCPQCEAVSL